MMQIASVVKLQLGNANRWKLAAVHGHDAMSFLAEFKGEVEGYLPLRWSSCWADISVIRATSAAEYAIYILPTSVQVVSFVKWEELGVSEAHNSSSFCFTVRRAWMKSKAFWKMYTFLSVSWGLLLLYKLCSVSFVLFICVILQGPYFSGLRFILILENFVMFM